MRISMLRTSTLLVCFLALGACVKDQQAARTRNSGVDKEPEKQEQPTPKKLPVEEKPASNDQDLPPIEQPK